MNIFWLDPSKTESNPPKSMEILENTQSLGQRSSAMAATFRTSRYPMNIVLYFFDVYKSLIFSGFCTKNNEQKTSK